MQKDEPQTISYYIENKDLIVKSLFKRRESLEMKRFTCNQAELQQIELEIKQISNSINFQENFL